MRIKSLYGKYIEEREGMEIIEVQVGFATYQFQGEDVYLRDLYVVPEARKSGKATYLADLVAGIAKDRGLKGMIGSVSTKDPMATQNIQVLLSYGMQFKTASPDLLVFYKEFK